MLHYDLWGTPAHLHRIWMRRMAALWRSRQRSETSCASCSGCSTQRSDDAHAAVDLASGDSAPRPRDVQPGRDPRRVRRRDSRRDRRSSAKASVTSNRPRRISCLSRSRRPSATIRRPRSTATTPIARDPVPLGIAVHAERGLADDPALRAACEPRATTIVLFVRERKTARNRHWLAVCLPRTGAIHRVVGLAPGLVHVGARDSNARSSVRTGSGRGRRLAPPA